MWWQAFPLGRGDVVDARCHVSWVDYDRGGISVAAALAQSQLK